jgi:hypothetical protein
MTGYRDVDNTFEEVISWLERRKKEGGGPVLSIGIPLRFPNYGDPTCVYRLYDRLFDTLTSVLGPELLRLELYIPHTVVSGHFDWSSYIAWLDEAFPHLQELAILGSGGVVHTLPICADHNGPLSGLPQLRKLSFHHKPNPGHAIPIDHVALARYISGLGSASCIYHNVATTTNRAATEARVRDLTLLVRTERGECLHRIS